MTSFYWSPELVTVTKLKAKSKCGESFSKSFFFSKFGNEVFKWEYCYRIVPFIFIFRILTKFHTQDKKKKKTPQWTNPTSVFFFDKFCTVATKKKNKKIAN
jgi:hypothetical protein